MGQTCGKSKKRDSRNNINNPSGPQQTSQQNGLTPTVLITTNSKRDEMEGSELDIGSEDETVCQSWPWKDACFFEPMQSPIDIILKNVLPIEMPPLKLVGQINPDILCIIKNTGEYLKITISGERYKPFLYGGPLRDLYLLDHIRLHWGETNKIGSEHFMNGEAYSLEAQGIFYKQTYSTLNYAQEYSDGVMIMVTFGEEVPWRGGLIESVIKEIGNISTEGSEAPVYGSDSILWFLDAIDQNTKYFAYPGSYTNPPYTENITYIVLPKPFSVNASQLLKLRELESSTTESGYLTSNRRLIQPLNDRPVLVVYNKKQMKPDESKFRSLIYAFKSCMAPQEGDELTI